MDTNHRHGEERGRHVESDFTRTGEHTGHGTTMTVSERFCGHCNEWVRVAGVMGGLKFMAKHDSGDCTAAAVGGAL